MGREKPPALSGLSGGGVGETLTYASKNRVIGGVNMRDGERSGSG